MEFKEDIVLQIVDKKGRPRFLIKDEEGEIVKIDELIFPVKELEEKEESEDASKMATKPRTKVD